MSEVVRQEILFFAACVLTGVGLMWFYDIFRMLRRWISHSVLAVNVEDFFYWCGTSFIIFIMIFQKNNGILRGYAFVGILIGVWAQLWIQSLFRKIWTKLLKKAGKKGKMTDDKSG